MAGAIKRQTEHGGARHAQDKFYTKTTITGQLVATIIPALKNADRIVEPSAGGGAFLTALTGHGFTYKAYDIEPEHDSITPANWFDITRNDIGEGALVIVGNPPFGVRADLAKEFIKHSVKLGAETIAFVLPQTFSKQTNQTVKLYPEEYRLIIEQPLPAESFTLDGESFHIPCSWYVWTMNPSHHAGVDLRKRKAQPSADFIFLPRGDSSADFTINGNSGRVKDLGEVTNPKAEHYIRVTDRGKVGVLRALFEGFTYPFVSSVNGGVAWVGQQEILEAYNSQ